jgi:hypothetical protein
MAIEPSDDVPGLSDEKVTVPKGRRRKRKPKAGTGFERPKGGAGTTNVPADFMGEGQLLKRVVVPDSPETDTGHVVSRSIIEFRRFTPLGEPNSLIRLEVVREMLMMENALYSNNSEYTLNDPYSKFAIANLAEYYDMCATYIITYRFAKYIWLLCSQQMEDQPVGLRKYARKILGGTRGLKNILSSSESIIKTHIHLPPGMMTVIDNTFGIFMSQKTNSDRKVHIVGVHVPLNYASYKCENSRGSDQFELRNNFTLEDCRTKIDVLDEEYPDYGIFALGDDYPYNPETVVCVPSLCKRDTIAMIHILDNFEKWMTVKNGAFRSVDTLFNVIVPDWKLSNFSFNPTVIPNFTEAQEALAYNFPLARPQGGMTENGVTESCDRRLPNENRVVIKSKEEVYPYLNNFLNWSTNRTDMSSVYVSGDIDPKPMVDGSYPEVFPGLFSRLVTAREINDGNHYSQIHFILESGFTEPVTKLKEAVTLNLRWFMSQDYDRQFELLQYDQEAYAISPFEMVHDASKFVKWYLASEEFINSRTFRSEVD